MTPNFTIQINVQLDASERLARLLTGLSTYAGGAANPHTQEEKPLPEPEPEPTPEPEPEPTPEPEPAAEPVPEPTDEPEPAPGPAKKLTEADIRDAIDRCRRRIEGEDYETNAKSEGRKKYHNALSTWFRQTAELIGGINKPSKLPVEKREAFVRECERAVILEDGTIGINQAF